MKTALTSGSSGAREPSYYTASLDVDTDYPRLEGSVNVDVAIIGGGFTGVACAVELAERGLKVAVVETHKIRWGAGGVNGGPGTVTRSGQAALRTQVRET